MRVAGVDVGTTLTKCCWTGSDGSRKFMSTADVPASEILYHLKLDGITFLHIAGINQLPLEFHEFAALRRLASEDPVTAEVTLQIKGVKTLLKEQGKTFEKFLVVSIGTGVSYTFVDSERINRFPIGNAMGGGFLRAVGMLHGIHFCDGRFDADRFNTLASNGVSLDILVEDLLPYMSQSPMGKFVVSHFGRVNAQTRDEDACATAVRCVATLIARDFMLMNMIPGFAIPEHIIFVGSVPERICSIQPVLDNFCVMLGKKSVYLIHSDFALALGTWLGVETPAIATT